MVNWYLYRDGLEKPEFPVYGGMTEQGEPIFVARAWHKRNLLPGYALGGTGYFTFEGKVITKTEFEVLLIGDITVGTLERTLPHLRLVVGHTDKHEPLYTGLAYIHNGVQMMCGQVYKGVLSIALNGKVFTTDRDVKIIAKLS
ncbi:Hypothetical predicted protein [Cloeon dipterum]|uniref:Uncharacterized protein n=1 Tax=Cloeon dipterum TaxID=197152 RepID=A0A8S1DQE9_9INSE|nr:Hypothetical predicted protein [Cloeon dipterum]